MAFDKMTAEDICAELGQRCKLQRLAQNLVREELAERANVSVGALRKLEACGQTNVDTLLRVAQALGIVNDLMPAFSLPAELQSSTPALPAGPRKRATKRYGIPSATGSVPVLG